MPVNEARRFRVRIKADGLTIDGKPAPKGIDLHQAGHADAARLAIHANADVLIPVRFRRVVRDGREVTPLQPPGSRAWMRWQQAEAKAKAGEVTILDHFKPGWQANA